LNHTISLCDWYPGNLCRPSLNSRNNGSRLEQDKQKVITLDLGSNELDGTLPDEVALLTDLQFLILDDNPLLSGSLVSSIGSLSSLTDFSARRVGFIGSFPSGLNRLTQLQTFELQGTSGMSGATLPTELWTLPELNVLSLEGVGITGSIPASPVCPHEVYLKDNQLVGSIPTLYEGDWSNLEVLDLRNNELTGTIPSGLSHVWEQSLLVLRLEGNNLVGNVTICDDYEKSIVTSGASHAFSVDCLGPVTCNCCTLCCSDGTECEIPTRKT